MVDMLYLYHHLVFIEILASDLMVEESWKRLAKVIKIRWLCLEDGDSTSGIYHEQSLDSVLAPHSKTSWGDVISQFSSDVPCLATRQIVSLFFYIRSCSNHVMG